MTHWAEGLELEPMRDGYTPLEAVVIVKALDPDGDVCLITQRSEALNAWEALGMVVTTADDLRAALQRSDDD